MIERSPRAPVLRGLAGDGAPSKRLEILKQAAPRISRVGFLWNPNHPDNELPEAERAAASLGVDSGRSRCAARRISTLPSRQRPMRESTHSTSSRRG
jgi:hypothetical protein